MKVIDTMGDVWLSYMSLYTSGEKILCSCYGIHLFGGISFKFDLVIGMAEVSHNPVILVTQEQILLSPAGR